MAKNFASVLASLRAAGEERLQEVDSVYTINCEWLLEQFKHSQASLAGLTATTQATVNEAEEQQSTAKAHSRQVQQHGKLDKTSANVLQLKQPPGAEAHSPGRDASPAAAPSSRVLRSRKGQADALPAKSAQDSAASKQFPSPPKTRAGRKRNQAASKTANTRRGTKAAHQHAEATDEPNLAQHPEEQALQQSLITEAPDSHNMGRAHIPDAVLATAGSLQEVQAEPISSFPLDERPHVDTAAAPPADPVFVASPELVAEKQQQASELMLASTSKHKKRKQSAVGESLIASDSKRLHSSTAKLRQTDSPMGGNPAVKHGESASLQTAAGPASSGDDLQDQRQESLTLADSMDNSSPYEMEQPPGSPAPITDLQPSVPSLVDSVPDSSGALAAQVGVNAAVPASPADARNSDYQDAQERLSSPVHVSADPVRSGAEQPAESPSTSMHEDEHQAAAASPSPSDPPAQGAEAPRHLPVVLDLAQASPIHVCVEAEPDTSVLDKAEDSSSAAAAGLDAPITDSTADLQTNMASALGAAAAVPLPSSASIQGDALDRKPTSSDAAAANGLAGNLVSAIRSFLPGGKPPEPQLAHGKKPVKVKALEAADAARRKEAAKNADRIKQKGTLDKQRAERAKAKQEEEQQKAQEDAKRRQEATRKREEEAAQRRRAKEDAERKERQERQLKAEASRAKKKADELKKKEPERTVSRPAEAQPSRAPLQAHSSNVQAPAVAQAAQPGSKPMPPPTGPVAPRLPWPPQPQAPTGSAPAAAPSMPLASASVQPAAAQQLQGQPAAAAPQTQARQISKLGVPEAETYQISPYRGDDSDAESSEDDDPKKPIPEWARGRALMQQLASQVQTDPDEVFQQHRKTCSLDEVFGHSELDKNNKQKKDLSRRSSSGNWIEDRVTWKEELSYKKAMGYM